MNWDQRKKIVEKTFKHANQLHAFLRYDLDDLPHNEGSDWDVAVADKNGFGTSLGCLGMPLIVVDQPYVTQHFFEWGQVDLLPRFEWHGFEYLEESRFWQMCSEGADGVTRPALVHDAFIAWMTGLLWGGKHPSKYEEFIVRGCESNRREFSRCCEWAFGVDIAQKLVDSVNSKFTEDCSKFVGEMRAMLFWKSLQRNAFETLGGWFKHWSIQIQHHWRPPFPWVSFLGPDGAGKTSVIGDLTHRLVASRMKICEIHWCPHWNHKDSSEKGLANENPHGEKVKGRMGSMAQLLWIALRWWRARLGCIWHKRAKESLLITDRHYEDLMVDPRRFRNTSSNWLVRRVFAFLPKPDFTIVLSGDAQIINSRKKEVGVEETERQCQAYEELSRNNNRSVVIDSSRSFQEVSDEVYYAVVKFLRTYNP